MTIRKPGCIGTQTFGYRGQAMGYAAIASLYGQTRRDNGPFDDILTAQGRAKELLGELEREHLTRMHLHNSSSDGR